MNFFHKRPDLAASMKDEARLEENASHLEKEIDQYADELAKIKQARDRMMAQIRQLRHSLMNERDPARRKSLLEEKDHLENKILVLGERRTKDLKKTVRDAKEVNSILSREKHIDDDLLDAA